MTPSTAYANIAAILLAILAGILLSLGYSLHPSWWAVWLAPIPLLLATLGKPTRTARWLGTLAGVVAGVTTADYYSEIMGWPITLLVILGRAWFWGTGAAVTASAARRLSPGLAMLVLPLYGAAIETLLTALSPHGSHGILAYSQMDMLPLVQIAALGGAPAITFLTLAGGTVAGFWAAYLLKAPIPTPGWASLMIVALVGSAVWFGEMRLQTKPDGDELTVALLSTDQFPGKPEDWSEVWQAYRPAAESVADGSLLVLPEKLALLSASQTREAAAQLSELAQRHHSLVVAGIEQRSDDNLYANQAIIARPDGKVDFYDKQHPVPVMEARDRPGQINLTEQFGQWILGIAICKDMHYPQLGRAYGHQQVGLMLVPTWDFGRDAWLSDRLTSLRGVESGFAIARATRHGISSLSDNRGRIIGEMQSGNGVNLMQGRISLTHQGETTLYQRVGDLFGWSCLLATVALRVSLWHRRPRAAAAAAVPG